MRTMANALLGQPLLGQSLLGQDASLRRGARRLYAESGLEALLRRYGEPHLTGSAALGLMTWPDLDLYLAAEEMPLERFFRLGADLAALLHPVRMTFRDERARRAADAQDAGPSDPVAALPEGLYWGLQLAEQAEGAWNIDLWAVSPREAARRLAVRDAIAARLTPEARLRILAIKDAVWRDPAYRAAFHSTDIYDAVLEHGVADVEGLRRYLEERTLKSRKAAE